MKCIVQRIVAFDHEEAEDIRQTIGMVEADPTDPPEFAIEDAYAQVDLDLKDHDTHEIHRISDTIEVQPD
jgi:hypothetical protein